MDDPLAAVEISVPNAAVEEWLRPALAEKLGILAGLEMTWFERGLRQRLGGDVRSDDVVDMNHLQMAAISLLGDAAKMQAAGLEIPRRYLEGAADDRERETRAFQLGGKLARLFEEYSLQRPEMLEVWRRGKRETQDDTEAWQARVFARLLGDEGALAAAGQGNFFLSELFNASFSAQASTLPWHLFGIGHLGPGYRRALTALASSQHLFLYLLAPELTEASESLNPVAEWTRSQSESLAELLALPTTTLEDLPDLRDDDGPLAAMRLGLAFDAANTDLAQDDAEARPPSFEIFSETDVAAEAERAVDELFACLEGQEAADSPVRFSDCALVWANSGSGPYEAALIQALESRGSPPLPYSRATAQTSGPVQRAASRLIEMAAAPLDRRGVLTLFREPCFRARFPEADPKLWTQFCEDLDITRGYDSKDQIDSYLDVERFHWDQGLKRLALGAFMTAAVSGVSPVFEGELASYAALETRGEDQNRAGLLLRLVRSLAEMGRDWQGRRRSPSEWACQFQLAVRAFLKAQTKAEEEAFGRVVEALGQLAQLDETAPADGLSYQQALQFSLHSLSGNVDSTATNSGRRRGITLSALSAVRGRSFRYLAILGLDANRFPDSDPHDALDLLQLSGRERDLNARQRDLAGLAEAVLSTRDYLRFSFSNRHAGTGDPQPASLVIRQLEAWNSSLRAEEPDSSSPKAPLESSRASWTFSRARRSEQRARELRASLEAFLAPGQELPGADDLIKALGLGRESDLPQLLLPRLFSPQGSASTPWPEHLELSTSKLANFLVDPLQTRAEYILGLERVESESAAEVVDEAFQAGGLESSVILRASFQDWLLKDSGDLDQIYKSKVELARLQSRWPHGLFEEFEQQKQRKVLSEWTRQLAKTGIVPQLQRLRFGRGEESESEVQIMDAIEFDALPPVLDEGVAAPIRIRLHGTTSCFLSSQGQVVVLAASDNIVRPLLRGFVDAHLLAASDLFPPMEYELICLQGKARSAKVRATIRLDRDSAREQLRRWTEDLLFDEDCVFAPGKPFLLRKQDEDIESLRSALEVEINLAANADQVSFGAIRHPEAYPLPSIDYLERIAKRRFDGLQPQAKAKTKAKKK